MDFNGIRNRNRRFFSIGKEHHFAGMGQQNFCFMQCILPFTQNRCNFSAIEKRIADCAIADALPFHLFQSGNLRRKPGASRCQDHSAGFKFFFSRLHYKAGKIVVHSQTDYFAFHKFYAQPFCTGNTVCFQLRSADRLCQAVIILNPLRFCQRSAAAGNNRYISAGAFCIQGGGNTGRPAANNQNIHNDSFF